MQQSVLPAGASVLELELGANLVPTRYSGHLLYFLRSTSYGASSAVVLVIQIQNASRQSSSLPGAPCCAAVIVWPLEKRVPLVNRHSTKVLSYVANNHSGLMPWSCNP